MNLELPDENETSTPLAGLEVQDIPNLSIQRRMALAMLLRCFPGTIVKREVDRFFTDIVDSDEAMSDSIYLDDYITNVADSLGAKFLSAKKIDCSNKKIRDAMKKVVSDFGTLLYLYENKQEEILKAIKQNLKEKPARQARFVYWLEEAVKALEVFNDQSIRNALRSDIEGEILKSLDTKTNNLAVALFLIQILDSSILSASPRSMLLVEMNLIISKILIAIK